MARLEPESLDTSLDEGALLDPNRVEADVETRPALPNQTFGLPTQETWVENLEDLVEGDLLPGDPGYVGNNAYTQDTYQYGNGVISSVPLDWGQGGVYPVDGPISSGWDGGRRSTGGHGGVDFTAPYGAPVRAAAGGVVENVNNLGNRSFGLYVTVRHPDGSLSYYAHLSGANVRPGQQVAAGEHIGAVGSSGYSTGPHLHFEVRPGAGQQASSGGTIDPIAWLNSRPQGTAAASTQTSRSAGRGQTLNYWQLKDVAKQAGFSDYNAGIMAAIAIKESGGVTTAWNNKGPDDSLGLWQINLRYNQAEINRRLQLGGAGTRDRLYDPIINARTAFALWREAGFRAWSVYNNGSWREAYQG